MFAPMRQTAFCKFNKNMLLSEVKRHPLSLLFMFILIFISFVFLSQFITLATLYPFLGTNTLQLAHIIAHPFDYPEMRMTILYLQGITSLFSMILAPLCFIRFFYPGRISAFTHVPNELLFITAAFLVIVSMPFNSWIADLNANLTLPEQWYALQEWMYQKEAELKNLTEYLTGFDSNTDFWFALLVIAFIPAIGEELVFRGIFQHLLLEISKNKHIAIWVSAIIFSAIHVQFLGFLPRMLLGALFGYLYVWTGNILIPMTCHFVNNGFTLLMIYLKNIRQINFDPESSRDIHWTVILGSACIFIVMLLLFKKQTEKAIFPILDEETALEHQNHLDD